MKCANKTLKQPLRTRAKIAAGIPPFTTILGIVLSYSLAFLFTVGRRCSGDTCIGVMIFYPMAAFGVIVSIVYGLGVLFGLIRLPKHLNDSIRIQICKGSLISIVLGAFLCWLWLWGDALY